MTRNHKGIWIVLSLVFIPHLAIASAYRYIDENGQTAYSQNPPINAQVTEIKAPPPPASSANTEKAAMQKTITNEKVNDEKAKEIKQEADVSKITEEEKHPNCLKAKKYLGELQLKARIKLVGPDGQVTLLSEEQKNAEIAKTQGMVKSFCTQPTI